MKKLHFGLIGHPLKQSISPFIHKHLFSLSHIDADYELLEIRPENLQQNINILSNLNGYNITTPHKENIIKYLDKTDEISRAIGAVNTVLNKEISCGYNTDIFGFEKALDLSGISCQKNIAILGCGGTARTVSYSALKTGCSVTYIVKEKSIEKAKRLVDELNITDAKICSKDEVCGEFDLIVNTTPVGMYPNNSLSADEALLKKCKSFFDVVYNPVNTASVKLAKEMGLKASGGLDMLVMQAVEAHKIWYGGEFLNEDIKTLILKCREKIEKDFGEKNE